MRVARRWKAFGGDGWCMAMRDDRVEIGKMGDGSTGWFGRGKGWSGAGCGRRSETIGFQLLLINQ